MPIFSTDSSYELRKNQLRIRLKIPQKFHGDPVISELTSKYNLQVNIQRAIVGANGVGDGWFDLLLIGRQDEINAALIYLSELDVEIWDKSNTETDGW